MEGKRSSKERGGAGKSEEEQGGTRRSREEQGGKTERSRERENFHFSSLKLLFLVPTCLIVKYGLWKRMQTEGRYQWAELWKASVPLFPDSVVSLSPAHPWVPDFLCHKQLATILRRHGAQEGLSWRKILPLSSGSIIGVSKFNWQKID